MSHPLSLGFLTVGDLEASAQIYVAARAGFEYVGLRPIPMGLPGEPALDLAGEPRLLDAARRALDETGVRVWDIELARVLDDVDYDSYAPAIAVGAQLGARVLLSSVWTTDRDTQVAGLRRVAQLAADQGLRVVAEFVPLSSVKRLDDMAALVREVDAPNLGLLIDSYHFDRADTDPGAIDALPAEWFPMMHLCDCPADKPENLEALREEVREHRLYVGEGAARNAEIIAKLPADAVLSIEEPHLERLRTLGHTEYAARCLTHAREFLAQHDLA